ncbi:MAG: DeoR family transcriptional regulator, partial [Spirochaetales bacterium]|nr:DeoR family transcriptional regulator [Spirochaetales bacterium]
MLVLMYTWFGRANMREDRLIRIEQYIREKKSVSIDTLCEVFNVSKNTIRRDIAEIISRTDIRK